MALEFTDDEFGEVRFQAAAHYRIFGSIHCPYLEGHVAFTTEGFRHLLFKSWNRGRSRQDQFMRLKHLSRAPEILKLSRTVQGTFQTNEWERRHRHGRWEQALVAVTYYEFVAVLSNLRFKVIVKQLPAGDRVFWSLIPFWRRTKEGKRLLHNGNPASD